MNDKTNSAWFAAGENFSLDNYPTHVADESKTKRELKKSLNKVVDKISNLQHKLYADGRQSVVFVFQAMDAAGKDSTIRAVFTGVNPAGSTAVTTKKYLWSVCMSRF